MLSLLMDCSPGSIASCACIAWLHVYLVSEPYILLAQQKQLPLERSYLRLLWIQLHHVTADQKTSFDIRWLLHHRALNCCKTPRELTQGQCTDHRRQRRIQTKHVNGNCIRRFMHQLCPMALGTLDNASSHLTQGCKTVAGY